MKQIVTLLAFLLVAVSACSSEQNPNQYTPNPSSPHHGNESRSTSASALVWVDAETEHILFTVDDIMAFDWDNQVFELKLDAALDFLAWMVPHKYQYRRLLVKDNKGTIYHGQWVNMTSSMSFEGPTYHSMGATTLFHISDGYGGGVLDKRDGNDALFSEHLYEGLEKVGVLRTIAVIRKSGEIKFLDLKKIYTYQVIESVNLGWHDCGKDLKIRVEYFANTFRIGRETRAHIFFAGGDNFFSQIDDIILEVKFTANEGRFRSDVRIEGISSSVIDEGIYVCRFRPWDPLPGSLSVQHGTGHISLSVLFRRKIDGGYETIRRLDFPEKDVHIAGPVPAESGAPPHQ